MKTIQATLAAVLVLAAAATARAEEASEPQASGPQASEVQPPGTARDPAKEAKDDKADLIPGEIGGTATTATDYVFRGLSQTDQKPAVQAGIEWKHDSGLFLGVWGSNVDFSDGDQASAEMDWYGGVRSSYAGFDFDLRGIYYSYPGADVPRRYDYWEVGFSIARPVVENLTVSAGYNFSPDYFAESGQAHYLHAEAAYTLGFLPIPVKLSAGLGRQMIDDNAAFGTPDYWHWSVSAAVTLEKVELALTYHDTDIDRSNCGASLGVCGARVVASASVAF